MQSPTHNNNNFTQKNNKITRGLDGGKKTFPFISPRKLPFLYNRFAVVESAASNWSLPVHRTGQSARDCLFDVAKNH